MEKSLNVVTYNIHNGKNSGTIIKNICHLAQAGANIFCLQEVRRISGEKFFIDALLENLGNEWQAEYLVQPDTHHLGLCTLWNSKILQMKTFEALLLPKRSKAHFYEKIFQKVVGKYPLPFQRAALIGDFKFQGGNLRITNVHLDWQGGAKQRYYQLYYLKQYLQNRPIADSEIFCGDFNSLGFYRFSHKHTKKIQALLGQDFEYAFHGKPTTSFWQTLDNIFVRNLKVANAEILKYAGSDHFPLLAEIKV